MSATMEVDTVLDITMKDGIMSFHADGGIGLII